MSDIDELSLEEITERLDELREKKDDLNDLRKLIGETSDNLERIENHELVDDELAVKFDLAQHILNWSTHQDLQVGKAIRYEREQLKRRKYELEREQELDELE